RAMIHIEILADESPVTQALAEAAAEAARRLGVAADVALINDPLVSSQHRAAVRPALLIDGAIVCTGSLASPEQIQDLILWRHPQLAHV
ncbi:MAG: thioredoxin family protein, partial [Phycisphaerae bacterium]